MADSITAKVFRYDPSIDAEPRYETYEVAWNDCESGIMSALEVLHAINEQDEQIGYDYCCSGSLCGRCSMSIDGTPRLACITPLKAGEHTFEPLPDFPIIKDLVVDRNKGYERIIAVDATIKTKEPIVGQKPIEEDLYRNTLDKINMCRECMCCYSVCPKVTEGGKWNDFVGPAAMAVIGHRHFDTVDESDRLFQAVTAGLFECDLCGECAKVCPARIPFMDVIGGMQKEAEARGLKPTTTDVIRF